MYLESIQFENIRNFSKTSITLTKKEILLVGRNNSGKTSALKIIDWLFNAFDIDEHWDNEGTSLNYKPTLLPARHTGKKARRVTFKIKITDKRRWKRFSCNSEGICKLRVKVLPNPFTICLKLGEPKRSEGWDDEDIAYDLIEALRSKFVVTYIPSFRDASSPRFSDSLDTAFQETLSEKALHSGKQGGSPSEYRKVKAISENLVQIAEQLTQPIISKIKSRAPNGMMLDAKVNLKSDPEEIVNWLTSQLEIKLVTGEHDDESVQTQAVGSGLQSILDVALHSEKGTNDDRKHILMLEEPEAFLHPSAQRLLARDIFENADNYKTIVTTHSPIIVEEAGFEPIQIAIDQTFYPNRETVQRRKEISSALLKGLGAEMVFARSILFVEGEGDRLFYDELRKRLAKHDSSGILDQFFVIPVGGKTTFIPWIKLVQSFDGSPSGQAIKWKVLLDADGATETRDIIRDIYGSIKRDTSDALGEVSRTIRIASTGGEADPTTVQDWLKSTRKANKALLNADYDIIFHIGDLEMCAFSKMSNAFQANIEDKIGSNFTSNEEFLKRLGTKAVTGKSVNRPLKHPWIRGYAGTFIPKDDVSPSTKKILKEWMTTVLKPSQADKILKSDW